MSVKTALGVVAFGAVLLHGCEGLTDDVSMQQTAWDDNDSTGTGKGDPQWGVYEETRIEGTVRRITRGTTFTTMSGSVYEVVDLVSESEYEHNPDVVVFTNGRLFRLVISNIGGSFLCRKIQ